MSSMSTPVLRGKGMVRDEQLTETDKLLALKFPHLQKSWLERMNRMLGYYKGDTENRGSFEMIARFKDWKLRLIDWNQRDILNDN